MTYAELPRPNAPRPLPFYLAMEEHLAALPAASLGEGAFFMWQVSPTVIFGRNQQIDSEVDVGYCRRHGIRFFRRKSGGGCVYADGDNVMMSAVVARRGDAPALFADFSRRVAAMLRAMGFAAEASGRNDVTVEGRKVAGGAVYMLADRCIIHSTMLIDTNLQHMLNAITPSSAKLQGRGVGSVRSRITTLREHQPGLSVEGFMAAARRAFCGEGALALTAADVAAIYRLSLPYYHPRWIYGEASTATYSHSARLEGVGEFRVNVATRGGRIERVGLAGDFFALGDVDARLLRPLVGCRYHPAAVVQRLAEAGVEAGEAVMGLDNRAFAALLFRQH